MVAGIKIWNWLAWVGTGMVLACSGCKKGVEVGDPVALITRSAAFATDDGALSVVYGIYGNLERNAGLSSGNHSISVLTSLSGDEMQLPQGSVTPEYIQFFTNMVPSTTIYFWSELYSKIYACNEALQGMDESTGIKPATKKQLTGEVKFLRAFCYFYLVNLYGDVPLALTTDYRVNNNLSRTSKDAVYTQIIADLNDAENLLGDDYLFNMAVIQNSRLTVNKQAVEAFLGRVYLYRGDWQLAEAASTAVINDPKYDLESDLEQVFLKNSRETIWQMQADNNTVNTYDASSFVMLPGGPPSPIGPGSMSEFLLNVFDSTDKRMKNWTGKLSVPTAGGDSLFYFYPYKYKVSSFQTTTVTELLVVLRLAEQYLIRAEARVQQGNLSEATNDLNIIRHRAGLGDADALDKEGLLNAIDRERQAELFTEWGHRWFDLKRTGRIDSVMTKVCAAKGISWNSYAQFFPIPVSDIQNDPNLQQNTGY